MEVSLDPDVLMVAEFMQRQFAADRLAAVAAGVASVAPILWGHYSPQPTDTTPVLTLREPAVC